MTSSDKKPSQTVDETSQALPTCWHQYYLLSATSMARFQAAWLENVSQAIKLEAEIFQALTENSEKITRCLTENNDNCTATELNEHYQEMVKTITDANLERFAKVSQLSHEFRRSLWEEI